MLRPTSAFPVSYYNIRKEQTHPFVPFLTNAFVSLYGELLPAGNTKSSTDCQPFSFCGAPGFFRGKLGFFRGKPSRSGEKPGFFREKPPRSGEKPGFGSWGQVV